MKTSAIQNPANIVQTLTAPSKQVDPSASAEFSFNQVLSRETSKLEVKAPSNAPQQNQNQPQVPSPAPQAQAPAQNAPAKAPSSESSDSEHTVATPEGPDDPANAAPIAAPAEMLALVNSMMQANNAQIDPKLATKSPASLAVETEGLPSMRGRAGVPVTAAPELQPSGTAAAPGEFEGQLLAAKRIGQPGEAAFDTGLPATLELQRKGGGSPFETGLPATLDAPGKAQTAEAEPKSAADLAAALGRAADGKPQAPGADALKTQDIQQSLKAQQAAPDIGIVKAQEAPQPVAATNVAPLQQAPQLAMQTGVPQAVEKLSPRVGTPGWDQAVGQKVVWMIAGGQQSATLTLNPPDLGPLQVVLNVSNAQANASFTAAQPEVRQALENALPRLREMLADTGIQLGQASVGSGSPNQFSAPGDQSHQASRQFVSASASSAEIPIAATSTNRPAVQSSGLGMVDTFA